MRRRTVLATLAFAPIWTRSAFASTYTTPLSYDPQGRPTAEVRVGGQGPFSFVIDTAAGATLLSAEIIAQLGLAPNGMRARVQGASGAIDADLYTLPEVEIAGLRRERLIGLQTPSDSASSAHHAGVLSVRAFADARLEFDFANGVLRIDTNAERAPMANAMDVQFRHNMFALAPVEIGGVAATAVIDTGARRTVANTILREALGFAENDARLRTVEPIGGATVHRTETVAADMASLVLVGHEYGAFELAFAALPVFATMQLAETPALILGIDILRRAQALSLDYTSRQIALRV